MDAELTETLVTSESWSDRSVLSSSDGSAIHFLSVSSCYRTSRGRHRLLSQGPPAADNAPIWFNFRAISNSVNSAGGKYLSFLASGRTCLQFGFDAFQ
jgi:hypothetical protein